jgi:hypothetical protein
MDRDFDSFDNDGLLVLNQAAGPRKARTLIVTGMARSGTSMVARALVAAGVHMGEIGDEIVYEDVEIGPALEASDTAALARIAAERDARFDVWGFKRPHLFSHAGPDVAASFRDPRFIITFRDPVAIAMRNRISELVTEACSLRDAAVDNRRCIEFALGLACPTMLVSYEKAVLRPDGFIEHLAAFCGLDLGASDRGRMVRSIEASRPAYLGAARRRFEGHVDGLRGSVVQGWCRQVGYDGPVPVEILVGGRRCAVTFADLERPDLAVVGFPSTRHGFAADIPGADSLGEEVLTVRVRDRLFELTGSGRRVSELRQV